MKLIDRLRAQPLTIAVIALSTIAHTWQLGRRPMAHDEAIDAWFSWQARGTGIIRYDPVYHGPLRFYLEGFVLDHFGISPGWTRAIAAIAGIAATIMIATSQRLLGRFGAPFAALLFAISPTILTVTRTGREDSLTGLVSLALLLVIANGLKEPRPRHIVGAGALLAVSFTLKETTFIFGLAGACFFVGLAAVAVLKPAGQARSFFQRLRGIGTLPWMWSTIVFIAILMVVFTSAFRYGAGFTSGLVDGIKYWWSQHEVGRGSQRSFFYGTIYAGYEWLLLSVAAVGAIVTVRRRSVVGAWFATMAVAQFALYSWAGEKFAWLALHPLIPAVLLAGLGAQAVFDRLQQP
ncbi:MAG TPA: flippase activity-associated protein Agl23, partial [Ilumatobacter sp.]